MPGRYPKRRARRSFNLREVRVATSLSIGALAAGDVIVGAITAAATDPIRIVSSKLTWAVTDIAAATDDGQEVGYCHSDYSSAEVEECLEQSGSIDLGSKIAQEQANRLVRTVGRMPGIAALNASLTLEEGSPIKTKLNWRLSSGDTLNLWIRNSSNAVWTTGSGITVQGSLWVKDE